MSTPALPKTMVEAHVSPDTTVSLHRAPLPQITSPYHVLIKVSVAGCNPKDWKMPAGLLKTISSCPNSGDDISGTVVAVGSGIHDFRAGDRVAALHQLGAPHGAYAEYALVWGHAMWPLPSAVSNEEAATLPMGLLMASVALFGLLRVAPRLWEPLTESRPLVVYGAAGTVGAYAVKLAQIMNIHPVICVAGRSKEFVRGLIDEGKGDVIVDYREGDDAVIRTVKKALRGEKLEYAFDAVSEKGSWKNICEVLERNGHLSLVLPFHQKEIPEGIDQTVAMVGSLWPGFRRPEGLHNLGLETGGVEFGYIVTRMLGRWIHEGKLKGHPYQVVAGGLRGVEDALKNLRDGKNSGMKYVVRIAETPGL